AQLASAAAAQLATGAATQGNGADTAASTGGQAWSTAASCKPGAPSSGAVRLLENGQPAVRHEHTSFGRSRQAACNRRPGAAPGTEQQVRRRAPQVRGTHTTASPGERSRRRATATRRARGIGSTGLSGGRPRQRL